MTKRSPVVASPHPDPYAHRKVARKATLVKRQLQSPTIEDGPSTSIAAAASTATQVAPNDTGQLAQHRVEGDLY